jgi:hypothetical protein
MHERMKQGEKDERGTPPVGAWTMKDLPEKSDITDPPNCVGIPKIVEIEYLVLIQANVADIKPWPLSQSFSPCLLQLGSLQIIQICYTLMVLVSFESIMMKALLCTFSTSLKRLKNGAFESK